jgi:hypothetical protein
MERKGLRCGLSSSLDEFGGLSLTLRSVLPTLKVKSGAVAGNRCLPDVPGGKDWTPALAAPR